MTDATPEVVVPELTTILNVNDDEATRYIITRILQRAGYDVIEAATGQEALDTIHADPERAALVVLDVNLPDINGVEVCRQLKADPTTAALPVLHVSATRIGTADRAYGLESGADGYLTQPVDPPVLTATVKALLRLSLSEARARIAAQAWEAVFSGIGDAVCLLDGDDRITRCNPAMAQLTSRPAEDLTGRFWSDVMREAFPGTTLPTEAKIEEGGRRTVAEIRVEQEGTIDRWLRVTTETLAQEPGTRIPVPGAIRIIADITDTKEASLRKFVFLREIFASVTEGSLRLCADETDLPERFPLAGEAVSLTNATARDLRVLVRSTAAALNFPLERAQDLETAVGETAMNVIVHAGVGTGEVRSNGEDCVQVWIEDTGGGIALDKLHLATLVRGYTTANTLGHGFWIILKSCDRVWLLTGEGGTTVVLEQDRKPMLPAWVRQAQE